MSTENTEVAGNQNPGETVTTEGTTQGQQSATATDAAKGEGQGQGTETTADLKTGDGQGEGGAPESYETFELPEGFSLEGERLEAATTWFKEQGWTQEQAQAAINAYTKFSGEDALNISTLVRQEVESERQQQVEQDGEEARKVLGKDYDAVVGYARTAVQHINNPELEALFNARGWGNNIHLLNAFATFGKTLRSDSSDTGGTTASTESKSLEDRMYPSMTR